MEKPRYLSHAAIVVVAITVVALLLVLAAAESQRRAAIESQRATLATLVERESRRMEGELRDLAVELAQHINSDPAFRELLEAGQAAPLEAYLDQQFRQYLISAGLVRLVQLYLYDPQFSLLAQSSRGPRAEDPNKVLCQGHLATLRHRQGADALKISAGLCTQTNRPFYSAVVPSGGLRLRGYIHVVLDPLHNFAMLERRLGMPVQLLYPSGAFGYRSPHWKSESDGLFTSVRWLQGVDGKAVLGVAVQGDMERYLERSERWRDRLLLVALLVLPVAVALGLWGWQRRLLRPLENSLLPAGEGGRGGPTKLAAAVERVQHDLARLHDQYEALAFYDPLTQLPNRALFQDRLAQLILLSERHAGKVGVLLLDLDDFSAINKGIGHRFGDVLLREVGRRLNQTLRASSTLARIGAPAEREEGDSTIARLGGDEFAILLPHLNGGQSAGSVARRVIDALARPFEIEGRTIVLSATAGIALYPEHGKDAETLLRRADIALYVAKQEEVPFMVYEAGQEEQGSTELELKTELRHAIEHGGLELHFQPQLDCRAGTIRAFEALLRWEHPRFGSVDPVEFVRLSEYKGLIGPLTEWVVEQAIGHCAAWREKGIDAGVTINIASRVLYDLSFPSRLEQAIRAHHLAPGVVWIELREEATQVDPGQIMQALIRLDAMGVKLAIDDFGTGFSSLGVLKELPVDEIKIDRSFVRDMLRSRDDASIVQATIDLAHDLGLKVVAEGVESEATLLRLQALGADVVQGFQISEPLPPEQVVEWLESVSWPARVEGE